MLIHDHNFLRHIFWNEIVKTQVYFASQHFIIHFVFTISAIFVVCSVVDFIRREILENRIIKIKKIVLIAEIMDMMLEK